MDCNECWRNGGTCNLLSGKCDCPLTRAGHACEQLTFPACTINSLPLRPTYLSRNWEDRLGKSQWLGFLTCKCIEEMVLMRNIWQISSYGRPRWKPYRAYCANLSSSAAQTVGELLYSPAHAHWLSIEITVVGKRMRDIGLSLSAPVQRSPPPFVARQIAQLVELDRCALACGRMGACVKGECRCYPPAVSAPNGTCTEQAHHGVRTPYLLEGAQQQRMLERCPGDCSALGTCDGEGFCSCAPGRFGFDCGLSLARRAEEAARGDCLLYIYDLPPALRIGDSFEYVFDLAISWRLLNSSARCADPNAAHYFWLLGPSDGPVLWDKLVWAQRTPYWRRGVAEGRARHVLLLLSERGPGDVFEADQLKIGKYELYDREINPASPDRQWLMLSYNGMADLRHDGVNMGRCLNCFQPNKDIVIAVKQSNTDVPSCAALRLNSVWSSTSPASHSAPPRDNLFFYAGRIHPDLTHARYLPYYENKSTPHVRALILQFEREDGFVVHNSFRDPRANGKRARGGAAAHATKLGGRELIKVASGKGRYDLRADAVALMRRSVFCWVPPGQRYGDARRHILATFFGCIPVFTVPDEDGHHTLQEHPDLRWEKMSVSVPQEQLHRLPSILRAISRDEISRMQSRLACAWRRLWYSSIYGPCLGESTQTDAFDALLYVLQKRVQLGRSSHPAHAACGVGDGFASSHSDH